MAKGVHHAWDEFLVNCQSYDSRPTQFSHHVLRKSFSLASEGNSQLTLPP